MTAGILESILFLASEAVSGEEQSSVPSTSDAEVPSTDTSLQHNMQHPKKMAVGLLYDHIQIHTSMRISIRMPTQVHASA